MSGWLIRVVDLDLDLDLGRCLYVSESFEVAMEVPPRSKRSRADDVCGGAERMSCELWMWSWMETRGVMMEAKRMIEYVVRDLSAYIFIRVK